MKGVPFLLLTFTCFMSACADPAASKPKAQVAEPSAPAETRPGDARAGTIRDYKPAGEAHRIDPATSKIEFTGSKVTGSHDGGFRSFNGVIDLIDTKPENSRVLVEIDMASVFSDADGLTKHLQTGDFFEVGKYPAATFASTRIAADPERGTDSFNVTGDLEMRGVKRSITFPAVIRTGGEDIGVNAEFSINRKDFGIVYAGKADDLIRDDVVLKLDLKAPRNK
jgi:polyisoprenoid-binding protein YceI